MNCRVCGKSLHVIFTWRNDLSGYYMKHSCYPESITDNNEQLVPLHEVPKSTVSRLRRVAEVDCYYGYAMQRSQEEMLQEHRLLVKAGKIGR